MYPLIGLVAGWALGGFLGHGLEAGLAGAFVGLVAGLVVRAKVAKPVDVPAPVPGAFVVDARLDALERRLAAVEAALARLAAGAAPAVSPGTAAAGPAAAAPAAALARSPLPPVGVSPPAIAGADGGATAANADGTLATPPTPVKPQPGLAAPAPRVPAYLSAAADPVASAGALPETPAWDPLGALWRWITGGNTLARVGIVVLFIGLAFLLKYAAERVTVPIEFRIAGVALLGVALLVTGWRLRERREGYAMILQGGGVGVLYLAVFAALKLYALVPAPLAFGLLVAIAAFSAVLAVRQDALALAAIGAIGGFLAPILTSSGQGSHVVLFSYYALLNAGIFAIAWFKAWRVLNLIGFACTFVIGTLWGVMRYRAEHFATTEPFLVLFFLFYVAIAVLYALRRSVEVRHYVDGTIVFGTPLVAAGLQHALVRHFEFGMAISAVLAAALYLVLARVLWGRRRDDLRLLVESFLALGVVFATLAVPLAVDARWTSAVWALEGAAIVWIGLRQGRPGARLFGVALQLAAGAAFAGAGSAWTAPLSGAGWPLANREFVGALLVALGGLATALVYDRGAAAVRPFERLLAPFGFAWGFLWWLAAGSNEIHRYVSPPWHPPALVLFATGTALAFALVRERLDWERAGIPALLLGPALLAGALAGALVSASGLDPDAHLFAQGGFVAWPLGIAVAFALVARLERAQALPADGAIARSAHAIVVWTLAVVLAHEASWLAAQFIGREGVWRVTPWGIVPAAVLAAVCGMAGRGLAPVATHVRAYLVVAAIPLLAWMFAFVLIAGIGGAGDPAPLPYVPLVNPLDLTLALIAVVSASWVRRLAGEGLDLRGIAPREIAVGAAAALAFLWVNAMALRTIHHWTGVAWTPHALWASTLVQAALSLLWTVVALAAMVVANRTAARAGWIAGAVLLAAVVVKLFAVDLSRAGSVARIVSFIGVGLLLLLIGYLAPVPPRRREAAP